MAENNIPDIAANAVLVKSESMPAGSEKVEGYDFNKGVDHHALLESFRTSGFQATNLGLAVQQINAMVIKIIFLNYKHLIFSILDQEKGRTIVRRR